MTDRETTDAALAAERTADETELKAVRDKLAEALSDDATDAATIAALRAELEALKAPPTTAKGAKIGLCPPLNNLFGNTPEMVRIFLMSDRAVDLTNVPDSAPIVVSRPSRGLWFGNRLAEAKAKRSGPVIGCAGQHEPENDVAKGSYTISYYRDWVKEDAAQFKSLSIPSAQVLMGGTCNAGTWEQWVVPEADQLWWDVYHGGAGEIPKTYKAPEDWLQVYFDANTKVGKPIGFAEFGSRTTAADNENYAAPNFVSWVKANSNYCRSHPTLKAAAWFNFGKRIRITNQAFADAWFKGV